MARTGATRRDADGPLQAIISRIQTNSTAKGSATDAPDGRLTDSVINTLGLTDQPFRPPGGQVPYFYNEHLEALLDELEACIGNGETLVVLEGAAESGKTCTVAQLLERFYDGGHVFLSRAGAATTADSIVRSMLGAYRSTTPQTLAECTDQLIDHLASNAELGATSVLVVEDAERMPAAELQTLLSEIDTLNSQLSEPASVLLTSSETAENLLAGLRSAHIEASQVDAFEMPRLDANETASYIATRLAAAGHEGDLPLDEREMQVLTHNSNGLPGYVDRSAAAALNQLVSRQQVHAILAPRQWWRATRQHLKWVVLGVAMLLLGLAIGAWNAQPTTQSDTLVKSLPLPGNPGAGAVPEATPVASDSLAAAEPELKTAESRVEPVPVTASTQPDATAVAAADAGAGNAQSLDGVTVAESASADTTQAAATDSTDDTASSQAGALEAGTRDESVQSEPTAAVETAASTDETAVLPAADESAAPAPSSDTVATVTTEPETGTAAATTAPDASERATTATDTATPDANGSAADAVVAAVDSTVAQAAAPLSNSVLSGVISGSKWIERRDPNRFTVQLLAGADEAALRLHARKHGMTSLSAIYRTLRNGEPWFALVHGDFDSSVDAREAVAGLPEIWQQNSPWIRRFDDVQKAIN